MFKKQMMLVTICLFVFQSVCFSRSFIFKLGKFSIKITEINEVNDEQAFIDIQEYFSRSDAVVNHYRIYEILKDKTISGKGESSINGVKMLLTFDNVSFAYDRITGKLLAKSGQAQIDRERFRHEYFSYNLDNCVIKLDAKSIKLNAKSAHAKVLIFVPGRLLASEDLEQLNLTKEKIDIEPSGKIDDTQFIANATFNIKNSKFRFSIAGASHAVNIGGTDGLSPDIITRPQGIFIKGTAARAIVNLFFTAHIKPSMGEVTYTLYADNPLPMVEPEIGYELNILNFKKVFKFAPRFVTIQKHLRARDTQPGEDRFRLPLEIIPTQPRSLIKKIQLIECWGNLQANLKLPPSVLDMANHRIELKRIDLQTDESGSIYGKVVVPKMKLSDVFFIETSDSNAWIHFNNWTGDGDGYYGTSEDYQCSKYIFPTLSFFSNDKILLRPGLTIFSGEFYFKAPQASIYYNGQLEPVNFLHSKFWGDLTVTPGGISGSLGSGGYSLVVNDMQSKTIEPDSIYLTLAEIIKKGNTLPEEPKCLFQLADLKIKEMVIDNILFCQNKIFSSSFSYDVHFPYPSYFNIGFVDTTLDDLGKFHHASGPNIKSEMDYLSLYAPQAEFIKPDYELNVTGKILWFWRLPFVLYPHSVKVRYLEDETKTKITIRESDLCISPLTSTDPLHSHGVIFNAKINGDGIFRLIDVAHDNTFGKFNEPDFECTLDSVKLAGLNQKPEDRKSDLMWWGKIHFPFFKWKSVHFGVRNVKPFLETNLELVGKGNKTLNDSLYVISKNVSYSYDKSFFYSNQAKYKKTAQGAYEPGELQIKKYVSATLKKLNYRDPEPEEFYIISTTQTLSDCYKLRKVIQRIKNPIDGESEFDLICYDAQARDALLDNLPDGTVTCTDTYIKGIYEILSINEATNDTTITLQIPDAKYIFSYPERLEADAAKATISSEESSNKKELDVPGLHFFYHDGIVDGWMSANTDIGVELPIDTSFELAFFMNPNCDFFYIFGNASFKFYIGIDGQILIAHAPLVLLDQEPFNLIRKLSESAYMNRDTFKKFCFGEFANDDNSVVTCVMVSGGVRPPLGILDVRLGGGLWYAGNTRDTYLGGYWMAKGELDLYAIVVRLTGSVGGRWQLPGYNIALHGEVNGYACVSAWLAHYYLNVNVGADYSTNDGFSIDFDGIDAWCGSGGCE